ncbi:hypothetical protein Acr_00g0077930 [Actinidia rufa]|uniref:RNase H type-1 domain-containing protein n=1 Tax=Actinidia rufa TaxID=165716 RepID=A0A7J0DVU8_9ERIC|nr:hypothetical protein Acr_00g0077930 [Actinidia rufa]
MIEVMVAKHETSNVDHQALNIGKKGAQFRQNPGHLVKLLTYRAWKSEEEEGHLALMNRCPRTPPRLLELILPPLNVPIAQIEDLIKKGYLRKFVADQPPLDSPERRYGDNRPTVGGIQVIHGRFGSRGCSSSSKKIHAQSASGRAEEEVYNLSSPSVSAHFPISFTNDDLRGLHLPHDDALVISAVIANFNVLRILVDNGSLVDILIDQVACDLGNGAVPNHRLVGFHCGRLPFAMQCDLRSPNAKRNKGNHLNLSFEDEIPYFNRSRRCEGRLESSKAYLIAVLTDQPLKQILQRFDTSGRLLKWSIELSEFHIDYRPTMAIKGEQIEYTIRIGFKATTKYEALLSGMKVATELGVDSLDTFSDSQLMVNQVQEDYLAKDTRMVAYLDEVKTMSRKIKDFKICQIPREEDKKADALTNLASTLISSQSGVYLLNS